MMGHADRRRTHGQEQHQRCGARQEHPKGAKPAKPAKVPKAIYEAELLRLQTELVEMQEWVKTSGTRLVVVFEGRDAAGKGGTIQRVAEYLNPRVCRIVALPAPTERQRTQWYFQRYVEHLPAAGEIVLFDRSWYNRAGVERVMGFATPQEYQRFLRQCPIFERLLIEDGILLRKYWFSVSDAEQERRFRDRLKDPLKQWKLSPMDLESLTRWEEYSRAKDDMFAATDNPTSRGWSSSRRTSGGPGSTRSPTCCRACRGSRSSAASCTCPSDPSPRATSGRRGSCSTRCPTTRRRWCKGPQPRSGVIL